MHVYLSFFDLCRLDEIIVFRQLTKGEVKQIADIMLGEVFKRAEEKEIKIDVTERFKVSVLLNVNALANAELTVLLRWQWSAWQTCLF